LEQGEKREDKSTKRTGKRPLSGCKIRKPYESKLVFEKKSGEREEREEEEEIENKEQKRNDVERKEQNRTEQNRTEEALFGIGWFVSSCCFCFTLVFRF